MSRDEALQHLFVLAIAAFLVVAPIFLVQPSNLEYSLIGLGVFFGVIDLIVAVALRRPVP
jgi:hypothetical protein